MDVTVVETSPLVTTVIDGAGAEAAEVFALQAKASADSAAEYLSSGSALFAPLSKGVTNGDNHDHAGGDGGTIAHSSLSGVGSNTHAQIDTFIETKAAASGLASLNSSSLVIQNPANATATPTADKIVVSDAGGKVDGWVTDASTSAKGKVQLATTTEAQTGTDTAKAVTPAGLAAGAKGLISSSTTIYVATTGSDTTGTGLVGAPYATISKALSSIAGKLIASGVVVTISVADGTYTVSSTITIDHPDADKIQILGNTSAETTVAIGSIDTTAKTITVAGNYVSNADAAKNIAVGDIVGLTGSSTSGLNGACVVSDVTFNGTNTVITCSTETFSSATVGGGSIIILPCNRCILKVPSGGTCFNLDKSKNIKLINGLRVSGLSGALYGILVNRTSGAIVGSNIIFDNLYYGIFAQEHSRIAVLGGIFKKCSYSAYCMSFGLIDIYNNPRTIISSSLICGVSANVQSAAYVLSSATILNGNAVDYSPAANTSGNYNSIVRVV